MKDRAGSGEKRGVVRQAAVRRDEDDPLGLVAAALGPDLAQVFLFVDPDTDLAALAAAAEFRFGDARVVACSTAGEIAASEGYTEGHIVAVGLPAAQFDTAILLVTDLSRMEPRTLISEVIRTRMSLDARAGRRPHAFGFVVVDGLSLAEDRLMGALSAGMGSIPIFGGSAGDGVRFGDARVAVDGRVYRDAAVVAFIRTDCPVEVFSHDHFVAGATKMVVTRADPESRTVFEINARPAAPEYARLLGKNPDHLSPFTFAAHPLVVRVGGRHHVRAIQRVSEDGALVFFAAIDEGIVLTLADARDMERDLDATLSGLAAAGPLEAILACDCVLRRIEATQSQMAHRVSQVLRRHGVVGFNTYGEQVGAKHVNQTMTGVAIYAPQGAGPGPGP